MAEAFVDTNVLIRFLTGDDPVKMRASAELFRQIAAGELAVRAPVTVIAEAAYVLTSRVTYGLPRARVGAALAGIVALEGFLVDGKERVLVALDEFSRSNVDFGDAMILASMEAEGATELYSYDRDFEQFRGVRRLEPVAVG